MTSFEKEWYIEVPWGKMCVIAWGNCLDPPVLLVHGLIDSAVTFRPLVSLLPKKFYYIGIDLPGNGRSDRFPPGLMVSSHDMVYAIEAVAKHFRWESFVYIGHSAGAVMGKMYTVAYPGKLSKLIELDPINFFAIPPEEFSRWYKYFFADYYANYHKYNTPKEKAPALKWENVLETLKTNRGLTDEQATEILRRITEPAGEGLVRYTYDLRNKIMNTTPFSPEHIKKIYTSVNTPILAVTAEDSLKKKLYRNTAFLLDEGVYPAGNYRMRQVPGGHDVHLTHPERIAPLVTQFLLYGLEGLGDKAKL